MRTAILLVSTVSLLAACSESADSTAPRSQPAKATALVAASAQTSDVNASAGARGGSGPSVTYLTSPVAKIDGITFISNVAIVTCPSGTSIVGGGYEFTYGVMNARIAYNGPVGTNTWKVLVYGEGAAQVWFKAFGTCVG